MPTETPSPDSSTTPRPLITPELSRVLWMSDPATLASHLTGGRFQIPPHVDLLSREIVETIRTGGRLLIQLPPRHSKSETGSVWTPIWLLNARPDRRVILASYEADFAATWGRRARNLIEEYQDELLVRLSEDSTAANRWNTPEGGGMVTVGAGGALTGRGADLLIIDDPHKNAEEAYSETHRERVWEWYTSTAFTRLEPGAAVIVIQTRWHEADLAGRILAQEGDRWTVVRLPAIAEEDDPLGRAPGAALWPQRYDEKALAKIRASVGERVWASLYQQSPVGESGGFFKKEWFTPRYDVVAEGVYRLPSGATVALSDLLRFGTVDLAVSTKTTADYSVIGSFGLTADGLLLVLDIDRARREGPDLVPAMARAVAKWGLSALYVEKAGMQLGILQEGRRAGLPVRELVADKDKVSRALLATAPCEGGRVLLPRHASWLEAFLMEVLAFPRAPHDDQVDVLSYAARTIADALTETRVAVSAPGASPRRRIGRLPIFDADAAGEPLAPGRPRRRFPRYGLPG